MNSVEPAHHVLQPFQAAPTNPDRRRKQPDAHAFELSLADEPAPAPGVEPEPEAVTAHSRGYEGVGEQVDIVA